MGQSDFHRGQRATARAATALKANTMQEMEKAAKPLTFHRNVPVYVKTVLRADGQKFVAFWQTSHGRPWVKVGSQNLHIHSEMFDTRQDAETAAIECAIADIDKDKGHDK